MTARYFTVERVARDWLISTIASIWLLLGFGTTAIQADDKPQPPNIIVILADDK